MEMMLNLGPAPLFPAMTQQTPRLKRRQHLGQYRIDRHLASGGFASVYAATDTVSRLRVALKVLDPKNNDDTLEELKREVRIASRLDHPNIVGIKTAGLVEDHFVIVTALAEESLDSRLGRRLGRQSMLDMAEQLLEGLSEAHSQRIVHCDVKPPNILLFPDGTLRLADFGLARLALRSLDASGSGTVGYMAPEQALGKPSLRSDVFSAGLVIYRMAAGALPEWPFEWPFPGAERLRRGYRREFIDFLRRAIEVNERRRFASCVPMHREFMRLKRRALLPARPR